MHKEGEIMEDISKKIIDTKYKILRREQLIRHRKDLHERYLNEYEALERMKRELNREEAEVAKLVKLSFEAILQSIHGGKDLRLEKEKADVARAELDYKQKLSDVEYLKYELSLLETQIKGYASLETDLEKYIELKKKLIPSEIRNHIKIMEEEYSALQILNKEMREAKSAGEKISSSLNAIIDHMDAYLEDARDPLFVYPEHEELDEMANEISIFRGLWITFKKEFQEAGLEADFQDDELMLDSLSNYVCTQEYLSANAHSSYAQLSQLYGNIKEMMQSLSMEYDKNKYRIDELELEIKKVIEVN